MVGMSGDNKFSLRVPGYIQSVCYIELLINNPTHPALEEPWEK